MTGTDWFRLSVMFIALQPLFRQKFRELARLLSQGTWTHDNAITFEAAKALGLPVSSEMPKEILDLMSLFPQPTRQTPAVSYLPFPRHRKPQ